MASPASPLPHRACEAIFRVPMCGIVGYIGSKKVSNVILDGLRRLEYRGYDSAGIAVIDGPNVKVVRAAGKLRELEENLRLTQLDGSFGLGHTRWATHGRSPPSAARASPSACAPGRTRRTPI